MEENRELQVSAIVGAVEAYMRLEEDVQKRARGDRYVGPTELWRISARQDSMQIRRLYQMGIFKKVLVKW